MNIIGIYETVKYMTVRQIKYRIFYTVRNNIIKRKPKKINIIFNPKRLPMNYASSVDCDIKVVDEILRNRIPSISGRVEIFHGEIDWNMKDESYRLVCFRINSFRFLFDLSNAYKQYGDETYIYKGFELIDDWISKNNKMISGDKWNAYVIADRLMNWIGFISEYADQNRLMKLTTHIYSQAKELVDSIEYQLGANHLLSEGRALIAAGAFLGNEQFYDMGKAILIKEYKVQFLKDGGHYERSVSYHVESLQQYFEAIWIMNHTGDDDSIKFAEMIKDSYRFLNEMIGVNGTIPLFNDSAIDYPFYDARDFLGTGGYIYESLPPNYKYGVYSSCWMMKDFNKIPIKWEGQWKNKETGILHHQFVYLDNLYSIYFDAGDNGPDSNLGHTHADALSILLSDKKRDILVDSGVFTYEPGELRSECRSTRAHNTIEIDDTNNAEVWGTFRTARRGHTKVEKYESNESSLRVRAAYDGYSKILKNPVVHTRSLIVNKLEGKICVNDELNCDETHKAVIRYHIGPQCSIEQIDDNTCLIDQRYRLKISGKINISPCKVSSKFGVLEDSYCIESMFYTKDMKIIETKIEIIGGNRK